jgi:hypothetical protein
VLGFKRGAGGLVAQAKARATNRTVHIYDFLVSLLLRSDYWTNANLDEARRRRVVCVEE